MKLLFYVLGLFFVTAINAQNETETITKTSTTRLDVNYYYGSILAHNPDIVHLITDHPRGFIASYNKQTYGFNDWESRYNYPDFGATFIYQDLKNYNLGENYSLYAHYNFYFLKRRLKFRVAQGIAYANKPYDKKDNFRNNAYGTRLLSSTFLMLNYDKPNLFKGFGIQAGISLIHYSNANVKAPNNSTNTLVFNAGINYNLDYESISEYIDSTEEKSFKEPVKYNFVFRGGANESDVVNSGQFPFYILSAYADKRLNRKSAVQVGADFFASLFLKEYIKYKAIAFPSENIKGDEDYRRVGLFVGHELFINKTSIITQLGYYVYYPFDFEGRVYSRFGLKRYFGKKVFGVLSLKTHAAKAETVEFGIGIRL